MGNAHENAAILVSVLNNRPSPFLETTVLEIRVSVSMPMSKADKYQGQVELARQVIASGKALENSDYYRVSKMSQNFCHVSWSKGRVKLKRWSEEGILASRLSFG